MLEKIKLQLGIVDPGKDDLLNILIEDATNMILIYIGESILPIQLESIVRQITIKAYNKLGDEGLKTLGIEGSSFSYEDDILTGYYSVLDNYKLNKKTNKVRFL